jgi:hypothetical protein
MVVEDGADCPQGEAPGTKPIRSTERRPAEFESEDEHSDGNNQDETSIKSDDDDDINVHHLDENLEPDGVSSLLQQLDQLCRVNPVNLD